MTRLHRGWAVATAFSLAAGFAPACLADVQLRVAQLGYEPGHQALAFLMTVNGQDFVDSVDVVDADEHVVGGATIGAFNSVWGRYLVRRLSFNVGAPGRYHLVAHARTQTRSVEFPVAAADALYTGALGNALQFYQAERDGPEVVPGPLRGAPGHLNDAAATAYATPTFDANDNIVGTLQPTGAVRDAAGGWWDAGDYLKFVQTHSYTVGMLLTGVRDFPAQMGARSAHDFTAEARFGLEWLLKMWDDDSGTLYYQVGIGTDFADHPWISDHDLWRLPEVDDAYGGDDPTFQYIRHRPLLQAGPAGAPVSPNLAGRLAASFALGYTVFKHADPAFAARCLRAAEHVYALADTQPAGPLLTVAPNDFYPESRWHDDMEWGATELALALRFAARPLPAGLPQRSPRPYLRDATTWAAAVIDVDQPGADPLTLYDVSPLAHYDLHRALAAMAGSGAGGLKVTPQRLQDTIVQSVSLARRRSKLDPFGFGTAWNDWDSTTRGFGLSVMAAQAAQLTGDKRWAASSREWLGNVLGANAWGLSLIVGDGADFPQCLQHQGANLLGSLTGSGTLLVGAAVEGPNATNSVVGGHPGGSRVCPVDGGDRFARFDGEGAEFVDRASNYPNTEPAIDLTAASPLMFAWQVARRPARDALR